MSVLSKDADVSVRWSTAERARALKRIIPKAAILAALRRSGRGLAPCRRLPRWFQERAPTSRTHGRLPDGSSKRLFNSFALARCPHSGTGLNA